MWLDTPFSLLAIQCGFFIIMKELCVDEHWLVVFLVFQAPEEPSGLQAPLAHSVQTFGSLPSDLRPCRRVRFRTLSRASLCPQKNFSNANANSNFGDFNSNSNNFNPSNSNFGPNSNSSFNTSNSSSLSPPSFVRPDPYATANTPKSALTTPVLKEVAVNSNLAKGSAPSIGALMPFSPLVLEDVVGLGSRGQSQSERQRQQQYDPLTLRVDGASHGVGVVEEEHGAWYGWEWECGQQEIFDGDVGGSEGEFDCGGVEWKWGGYDDVRYLFSFCFVEFT